MRLGVLLVLLLALIPDDAVAQICAGDCNGDGQVAVNELVQAVNVALDRAPIDSCANVDADANAQVTVNELVGAVNNLLRGCGSATATPSPTPTPTGADELPPTTNEALIAWLQAQRYRNWAAEGQHPGSGPHFGDVRTFVNTALLDALDAGGDSHPVGAAAVKELFGGSGANVRGWAVSVKVEDGQAGNGWYWFEYYNGNVLASGVGNRSCTGCHGGGTDYVCTPYPLQSGGQTIPALCP